jgi:hypothetical protein
MVRAQEARPAAAATHGRLFLATFEWPTELICPKDHERIDPGGTPSREV